MKKRSRSAAAKKGWATRRKRDAAKRAERDRRSAAARRGWELRRRREAQERVRRKREGGGVVIKPPTPPKPPKPPEYFPPFEDEADMAGEWEIGFSYRGTDASSAVDVNIRIAREDGRPMGLTEAHTVFAAMREQLEPNADPIPSGYVMSYIDWSRPRWSGTTRGGIDGDLYDLLSFSNPMYVEKDNDAAWSDPQPRFGSVKS